MIDLFKECVEKSKQHPNFIALLGKNNFAARNYINQWTDGFIDRDGKIVKEFQTTFNSTFWELYLFNVFKNWNFVFDFNHQTPDFIIKQPFDINIEAVIANNAFSETPEWQKDISKQLEENEKEKIIYTAVLRLSNAIIGKYKKLKNEYSSLSHVSRKPFILALAPFEQPYFWEQTHEAINQALYGYKKTIYKNIDAKNERIILGHEYIDFITKDNGAEIQLGFFSNNLMPEISAIIFSNVATVGKVRAMTKDSDKRDIYFTFAKFNKEGLYAHEGTLPKSKYHENLEDGLGVFINPYAKYPVTDDFVSLFPNFTSWDIENKLPIGDARDGELFKRRVNIFEIQEIDN
jgi:hypothetical protein